jgi:hypothetical protein
VLDDDREGEDDFPGSLTDPAERIAVDIPSVDPPEVSTEFPTTDFEGADVSPELFRTFWLLVVLLNIGLFAASLGVMLLYFRGQVQFGGGLFVVGVAALTYSYGRYRRYLDGRDGSDGSDSESTRESNNE